MKKFLGILILMVFVLNLGFCQKNQETAEEKEKFLRWLEEVLEKNKGD